MGMEKAKRMQIFCERSMNRIQQLFIFEDRSREWIGRWLEYLAQRTRRRGISPKQMGYRRRSKDSGRYQLSESYLIFFLICFV